MKSLMKRTGIVLLTALLSVLIINRVGAADDSSRPFGDSRVFTTLPASPGFPESIAVNGNKVYVGGAAAFGTAGSGPSKILVYDVRTGEFIREYVIQGQDLSQEHVVAGADRPLP